MISGRKSYVLSLCCGKFLFMAKGRIFNNAMPCFESHFVCAVLSYVFHGKVFWYTGMWTFLQNGPRTSVASFWMVWICNKVYPLPFQNVRNAVDFMWKVQWGCKHCNMQTMMCGERYDAMTCNFLSGITINLGAELGAMALHILILDSWHSSHL